MKKTMRTRLIEARKHRKLSQQELADWIGTTQNNVSRWELGLTTPNPYFRDKLCRLFDKSAQELGLLSDSTPDARPASEQSGETSKEEIHGEHLAGAVVPATSCLWSIPYRRNPWFTGREQVLQQMHSILHCEQTDSFSHTCTLSGLGGIGKTQTAIEYAYRYASNYAAIFWIGAETAEQITVSFIAIANLLNLPEKDDKEQKRTIMAVNRWLNNHDRWLLIVDNIEDMELLKNVVPSVRAGSLLFTSRKRTLGTSNQVLDLATMEPEEGRRFLLSRSRKLAPTASPSQLTPREESAAREIVTLMGGLPLALDQAGAYIEETQCNLEDYLQRYKQRRSWLLDRRGDSNQDHIASVEATLSLSFRQIEQRNQDAVEILRLCSFLAADAIPEELLTAAYPKLVDPFLLDEAIAALGTYSLVHRDAVSKSLYLHRLVQSVLQDNLPEQEHRAWIKRIIRAINQIFPEFVFEAWKQCERLLPHILQCLSHNTVEDLADKELAILLSKTGYYLTERSRYEEAERILKQAAHVYGQALGTDHPQVADTFINLSILYREQAKYSEAEAFLKRARALVEAQPDIEHTVAIRLYNALGSLYYSQGRFTEAEVCYKRGLGIKGSTQEIHDLRLVALLNNLGLIYIRQGKYAEAEPLLNRALFLYEQRLGCTHYKLVYPLLCLSDLYTRQERYTEAEPLLKRAINIWEQVLGPEHPKAMHPINNLGELYLQQGRYSEAESLLKRALSIGEQAMGPEYQLNAHPLGSLGELYLQQGRYSEAEPLLKRAIDILGRTAGAEYPEIAYPLDTLGMLYLKQKGYIDAELLLQRALKIREQGLGIESPEVARTLDKLGKLYAEQGRYEEAEAFYTRALDIRKQQLPPNHSWIAETSQGLASLYIAQAKYGEALPLYQQALSIYQQGLGHQHRKTRETQTQYLELLHVLRREDEATQPE